MPPIRTRSGFTLVELLVVIIIIAILMAILIPTINAARNSARRAVIATEISQLESAIEEYKTKNGGDFPPDFTRPPRVLEHLNRAFPRHDRIQARMWLASLNDDSNIGRWQVDPAEALVFWLSGLRKDPILPVTGTTTERHKFFDFRPERLVDNDGDGWPEYYPPGTPGCPYVYFHSSSYYILRPQNGSPSVETRYLQGSNNLVDTARYPAPGVYLNHAPPTRGVARPYAANPLQFLIVKKLPLENAWVEPTKFQIIAAGLDDDFGADPSPFDYKLVPDANANPPTLGLNLQAKDWDNLTSFSKGKQIKDLMP